MLFRLHNNINGCGDIKSLTRDLDRIVNLGQLDPFEFDIHYRTDNLDDLSCFFFFFLWLRFRFHVFFISGFHFFLCHFSLQRFYFLANASTAVMISSSSLVMDA